MMKTIIEDEFDVHDCECPALGVKHLHTVRHGVQGYKGPPGSYDRKPGGVPKSSGEMDILVNNDCGCYHKSGRHIHVETRGPRGPEGPRGDPTMKWIDEEKLEYKNERSSQVYIAIANCVWCSKYKEYGSHNHGVYEGYRGQQGPP